MLIAGARAGRAAESNDEKTLIESGKKEGIPEEVCYCTKESELQTPKIGTISKEDFGTEKGKGQCSNKSLGGFGPYLIFVISFTLAGFLNPNILHPKITKNTQKLQQIAPKSAKNAFFYVQSGKFHTGHWQDWEGTGSWGSERSQCEGVGRKVPEKIGGRY